MLPSVFISYSRRESPFVDALLDVLEDNDVEAWADYRSLVPARPWQQQLLEAIDHAEVFLLVVSRESLASQNVEFEYKRALEKQKRIILVIFEAVPLPEELEECEWIDFRGSFWWQRRKLLRQLQNPPSEQGPAPQKGFRTSLAVWLAFWLALAAIVISVPAWWTIYVPALLVPLPVRILRRDFDYYRVRFAVLTLPLALLLSWIFFNSYPQVDSIGMFCVLASLAVSPLLLLALSSGGMRLWGKPMASAPRFANPYRPKIKKPEPVPFFIEHAPEDRRYAESLAWALRKHGHLQVMSAGEAQADFVLISRYKTSTLINPEKRVVYPVILQDAPVIDAVIRRIQWIDFRRGVRHLDSLAKLLPEPSQLLKAMGVAPVGEQTLYPRIIQILDYFLALLGFFSICAWIPLMIELGPQFLALPDRQPFFIVNAVISGLILLIIFLCRRALLGRAGRLASLGGLAGSIFWVGVLGFAQSLYIIGHVTDAVSLAGALSAAVENDMRGSVSMFFPVSYSVGVLLMIFSAVFNWGDLWRWFPERVKKAR